MLESTQLLDFSLALGFPSLGEVLYQAGGVEGWEGQLVARVDKGGGGKDLPPVTIPEIIPMPPHKLHIIVPQLEPLLKTFRLILDRNRHQILLLQLLLNVIERRHLRLIILVWSHVADLKPREQELQVDRFILDIVQELLVLDLVLDLLAHPCHHGVLLGG